MLTNLLLALVVGCAAGQAGAPGAWQQAEGLARQGRAHEALEQFQRIVAERPDDADARVWVARLLRRLGHVKLAEREFQAALVHAPNHVDALVGLAAALRSRGRVVEANELLDRAERLAPQSADVLAARAQSLRLSGRSTEAERYYARARALNPDDPDITLGFDQARRVNRHRIEGSVQHEALTGSAPGGHAAEFGVDLRASDRLRVHARMQAHRRFSQDEARAGGGIEWRARPALTFRGSTMISPWAELIARMDTLGEVEQSRGRVELGAGVRAVRFAAAQVWIVAPAATVWMNDRTAVTGRYYASWTSFPQRPAALNHSALARVRYNVQPRVWLDVGYSRGYESLDTLSVDRLGSFRADTVSGGLLYHLGGLHSVSASVDYQRRSDARTMVRVTLAAVHRF